MSHLGPEMVLVMDSPGCTVRDDNCSFRGWLMAQSENGSR